MFDDHSVTVAFVKVLAVEFVTHRRASVALDLVDTRTAELLSPAPVSKVSPVVSELARRLAVTQEAVFRRDGDLLTLTENAMTQPLAVSNALRSFYRGAAGQRPTAAVAARSDDSQQAEALGGLLDGFDREIMRARLGGEGIQNRD